MNLRVDEGERYPTLFVELADELDVECEPAAVFDIPEPMWRRLREAQAELREAEVGILNLLAERGVLPAHLAGAWGLKRS